MWKLLGALGLFAAGALLIESAVRDRSEREADKLRNDLEARGYSPGEARMLALHWLSIRELGACPECQVGQCVERQLRAAHAARTSTPPPPPTPT